MTAFRQWRARRVQRKLAGLRAKLAAYRELAARAETIPGAIVLELADLPCKIAELETLATQLGEPTRRTQITKDSVRDLR